MKRQLLLAIDQGTTSSRAAVFDASGRRLALAQREFAQHFPQPGWVEHDPEEIFATVVWAMQEALAAVQAEPGELQAVGLTNQRETAVLWERATGQAVYPAIVWQSRQSAGVCERLRAAGATPLVRRKTGLVLDPYFSASKLTWLFEREPVLAARARAGELAFGTIDSWLIYRLTGGQVHATDVTNAARTLLFDIDVRAWDPELCRLFGVPEAVLPEVRPCDGHFGTVAAEFPAAGVPIAGVAGDQHAALVGQACFAPGMTKNTYGTGCFLLAETGPERVPSASGLLSTIAWQLGGACHYALEGSVFVAGAAVQWLRDGLGLIADAAETEALAQSVPDAGGVHFVPAFVGLGAPYWDEGARGLICGLTRGTTRAHLVRAALEAMAFQTADVLMATVADAKRPLAVLRVDGGACRNNFLMQFQADVLGVAVERPVETETTVLGAATLAGLAVGVWSKPEEAAQHWRLDRRFEPTWSSSERERALAGWRAAVARARS